MLADDGVGPDDRAGADVRARMNDSRRVGTHALLPRRALVRKHAQDELGFRHHRVVYVGDSVRASEARPARSESYFQAQSIAWNDLSPELGVVHTAEVHATLGYSV